MSKLRQDLVAVDAGLVGQTLVEAVFARVQARPAPTPPGPVGEALDDPDQALVTGSEARLEMALRRAGYLARVVEVELFDPAKQPAAWLAELLRARYADAGDWAAALAATCADLARSEPVGKPSPDDPAATTWRIPGPGGHVRHYVARRTIEEQLRGRDRPLDGDPADLKVPWAYGFFVRACEEVLPHDASPDISG
ncbi:MAG: hypothetical protein ACR2H2_03715 [Solirubrobacteraceae bacterium]